MKLPFTYDQFIEVFQNYNKSIFPAQFILYLIALTLIILLVRKQKAPSLFISYALAFFWIWMGLVYHILFFSKINKAAYLFGILFIIQGILFIRHSKTLIFKFHSVQKNITTILLITYALIIYPIIGHVIGHTYPGAPTFGLPCPTTIFTLGLLLLTEKKIPIFILIIPTLWVLIGTSAAFSLGFYEDLGLLLAAIISITLVVQKKSKFKSNTP